MDKLKDKFMKIIAKYAANYPDLTDHNLQETISEELVEEVNFTYNKVYADSTVIDKKRVFTNGEQVEIDFD